MILSAGFREAGRPDLEAETAKVSAETGFRFVGPNVQGIDYLPNKMCAMFFPVIKTRGPMAIISQSGTVTAALSEWADREGLGISAAVNLGNQTDLGESDYLEYLAGDEHTRAIATYIEGLKDGPRFLKTIKRVAGLKPVVVLKAGSSSAGAAVGRLPHRLPGWQPQGFPSRLPPVRIDLGPGPGAPLRCGQGLGPPQSAARRPGLFHLHLGRRGHPGG
ncbi:MAG: hypothetical protein JRJ59_03930 [Deltaproteobacteria bacterium]|nr:hypothetical protein [Deltaproteobacteria bacterium]